MENSGSKTLTASRIEKRFGPVVALKGASLELKSGELRALLGGNGSGKSTLSKILAGTVSHDAGDVLLDGERIIIRSPSDSLHLGIGVTHQELSLLSNLTVAENLMLSGLPTKMGVAIDRQTMRARAEEALKQVGLAEAADKKVAWLSTQDQYMVEFAKILISRPRFVVLDEITSALHRKQVEIIFDLVRKLRDEGCGVLLISHRLHEIYAVCEQISVMRNGEVVADVGLDSVTPEDLVGMMSLSGPKVKRDPLPACPAPAEADAQGAAAASGDPCALLAFKDVVIPGWSAKNSLTVQPGEILGIGGLKGQGQSELLRLIFGALPDARLNLEMEGKPVTVANPLDAIKHGIGFFSGDRQKEGVFPHRSVRENLISVPGSFKKNKNNGSITPAEMVKKLNIVLGSIGQRVSSLSGGNQQKVVIGRWLGTDCKVILADDPTKGVDVQARKEVHAILRELSSQGKAVIIASSDDYELVEIADRILVINEGAMAAELTGEERTVQQIVAASLPSTGNESQAHG